MLFGFKNRERSTAVTLNGVNTQIWCELGFLVNQINLRVDARHDNANKIRANYCGSFSFLSQSSLRVLLISLPLASIRCFVFVVHPN